MDFDMAKQQVKTQNNNPLRPAPKKIISQKQKNWIYTGIFLTIVLLLFIVNNSKSEDAEGPYPPGYELLKSKTLQLSDYKDKVVVLDFWATWCSPCRKGIPDLIELKNKYKDKGVEIIGISVDEYSRNTKDKVVPFINEFKINYPIVYADLSITEDYGGIKSVPTTFIIDKNGKIVDQFTGLISRDKLFAMIEKVLSGKYTPKSQATDFKLPIAE